jgi:hypothetical protein
MNAARVVILGAGVVASVVVFLLLRYPGLRRPQFRAGRRFTVLAAAAGGGAVMALFVLIAAVQP